MSNAATLRFVFVGVERDWKTYAGDVPPHAGRTYVYRSLPGNVVVWGASAEEAVERLRSALTFAMAADPKAWYRDAVGRMTMGAQGEQNRLLAEFWTSNRAKVQTMVVHDVECLLLETPPKLFASPAAAICGTK